MLVFMCKTCPKRQTFCYFKIAQFKYEKTDAFYRTQTSILLYVHRIIHVYKDYCATNTHTQTHDSVTWTCAFGRLVCAVRFEKCRRQ